MSTIAFDIDSFREQFPNQFPDPPNTDAYVEIFWNAATCLVSTDTQGPLSAECRRHVLNLVTAHLITLSASAQAGMQPGFIVSGSIDKISVTVQPPPSRTAFQFLLMQTPYGVEAFTILSLSVAGGFYEGGFNELGSFRRAGGTFTPPSLSPTTVSEVACPVLVAPPVAPFTLDFGSLIAPDSLTQAISMLAGCRVLSASYDGALDDDVTISLWSGSAIDAGSRFNVYFWDSDDRDGNVGATQSWQNVNPTGATILDGVILTGITSGNAAQDPNLVVITGVDNADTQALSLDIEVS